MTNTTSTPFKRLILRAVLNDVSPIVARVLSIPDDVEITELHDVFLSMLGWSYDPGFIIRVHGQEFNSYQRRSRGKRLRDFQLRRSCTSILRIIAKPENRVAYLRFTNRRGRTRDGTRS